MKRLLPVLMGFALLLLSSTEGWGADFQKGLDAYNNDNYAIALRELKPLAEQGNANAQYYLGRTYEFGTNQIGGDRSGNDETAVKWYRLAAEQGHAGAKSSLGNMYAEGSGVEKNYETAVKWYTLAVEQGDATAMLRMGLMYKRGEGVPRNLETSVKWYKRAAEKYRPTAEQGDARAAYELGRIYGGRLYFPMDIGAAIKWYTIAAKQGLVLAQYELASRYEIGGKGGAFKDASKAIKWYEIAAEQGHAYSAHTLGQNYEFGSNGFPQDFLLAIKWYKFSFERDHNRMGAFGLAKIYQEMRESELEDILSYMYFNISTANTTALMERVKLGRTMSAKNRQIAKDLTRECVAKNYKGCGEIVSIQKKLNPKIISKKNERLLPKSGSGSGFFVSKMGHVVTNAHVVRSCKRISVGENTNKQISVELVAKDKKNDLALLKMTSEKTKSLLVKLGIKVVPLASKGLLRSDDVELGEKVMVAGYPYGELFSNTVKVTRGIVSAIRGIGDDSSQFQLDAAVQRGNSGGPVYDEKGNIVGVVVAQLNKLKMAKAIGSLPENVNFGIKASTVRQFLTSSGLPTKWSSRSNSMSTKELAKIAQKQTVMVVCHQ